MTEANEEISRHRVKAADTGLRADRPPDAAYNVAQRMTYGSRPTLVGLRHRTLTVDFPCQWRQRAAASDQLVQRRMSDPIFLGEIVGVRI
jgi:hypothetical protein